MVPGTYWDISIHGVGRWMAKIHDHEKRGEREGGWAQRQYGKKKKRMQEWKKKRLQRHDVEADNLARRTEKWEDFDEGRWAGEAVEMTGMSHTFQDDEGLRVCLNKHAHIFTKNKKKGPWKGGWERREKAWQKEGANNNNNSKKKKMIKATEK